MKECILIIEDGTNLKELVVASIGDDHRLIHAKSREQATMLLATEPVSSIISYTHTSLVDGLEFCQFIRSTIQYCHIAYIFISTPDHHNAMADGLKVGADAILPASASPDLLRLQIANLLQNRSNMIAHYASLPFEDSRVIALSQSDAAFIRKIERYIHENMTRTNIDIGMLAGHMNISRATFYRRLKTLTSLSPKSLVDITRLKEAKRLILQNEYKLFEIGKMVGYNCQGSFTRGFSRHFDVTPMDFANAIAQKKRKFFSDTMIKLQAAS